MRIKFHHVSAATGILGSDYCGPATAKRIEYDVTPVGTVFYRIGYHRNGFGSWMEAKVGLAANPGRWILPDIRAIAPVATQFNIINVWCSANFEDCDELVLGSVH